MPSSCACRPGPATRDPMLWCLESTWDPGLGPLSRSGPREKLLTTPRFPAPLAYLEGQERSPGPLLLR